MTNMDNNKSLEKLLTEAFKSYQADGSFEELARTAESLLKRAETHPDENTEDTENTYTVLPMKEILNRLQLEGIKNKYSATVDIAVSVCFQYLKEENISSGKTVFKDNVAGILHAIVLLNSIPAEGRDKKFRNICEQLCDSWLHMLGHDKESLTTSEALKAAETNDED